MGSKNLFWDTQIDRAMYFALTHFQGFWDVVQKVPVLDRRINAFLINGDISKVPSRPYALSTQSSYTTWDSLTDRTWSGRHLPPVERKAEDLPPASEVAKLFLRPKSGMVPSPRSTVLFPHFAQWFTDGFLRTDYRDPRKNTSNHEIDLSNLYGPNAKVTAMLRAPADGKLRSQIINNEEYPPFFFDESGTPKKEFEDLPMGGVMLEAFDGLFQDHMGRTARDPKLFAVGGDRVNSTVGFVAMNTLFLREHNRVCDVLKAKHPLWDSDRLFQTARNVLIGVLSKIVIEEYINHIAPYNFKFKLQPAGFEGQRWYRQNWMAVEFNLLYRWHPLVPDSYRIGGRDYPLRDVMYNNQILIDRGLGALLEDASSQPAGKIGLFNVPEELLWVVEKSIGVGRKNHLAGYNDYLELCRFPRAKSFEDISGDKAVQDGLKDLYGHVDNVEYYTGLFAEDVRGNSAVARLIGRLVGIDAFSQALTNPLLAANIYHEGTFSKAGMEILESTPSLEVLVNRNVPAGSRHYHLTMDLHARPAALTNGQAGH